MKEEYLALIKVLDRAKRDAKDVLEFNHDEPRDSFDYLLRMVMDDAHEILDLAHEFRHAARLTKT